MTRELALFEHKTNVELDALRGTARTQALGEVIRSSAAQDLAGLIASGGLNIDGLVDRSKSREVSSHYKWCLISSTNFSLWVNQYKDEPSSGYATSIHNHRYSFASSVLNGEILQRSFTVDHDEEKLVSVRLEREWATSPGESYELDKDVVHQVLSWSGGTRTLVLKGPAERPSSSTFDLVNFRVRAMTSMSAMSPSQGRLALPR